MSMGSMKEELYFVVKLYVRCTPTMCQRDHSEERSPKKAEGGEWIHIVSEIVSSDRDQSQVLYFA